MGALRSYSGTSREVYHFQASKPQQPGVSIQKLAYDRSLDSDAAVRERMAGQELRVPPNYLMHLLAGYRAADEAGDDVVKAVCYGLVRQELKVGVRALAPRSMALHAAFGLRDQRSRRAPKRLATRLSASRRRSGRREARARATTSTDSPKRGSSPLPATSSRWTWPSVRGISRRSVATAQSTTSSTSSSSGSSRRWVEVFWVVLFWCSRVGHDIGYFQSVGGDEEEFAKLTAHTSTPKNKGKYKRIPYMSLTAIAELMTELEGWNKAGGDEMTQAQMKAFNSHLNSFGLKLDNYRSGKARKRKLGESG